MPWLVVCKTWFYLLISTLALKIRCFFSEWSKRYHRESELFIDWGCRGLSPYCPCPRNQFFLAQHCNRIFHGRWRSTASGGCDRWKRCQSSSPPPSGMINNPFLLCHFFSDRYRCKIVRFLQMYNQGLVSHF